MLKPCATLAAAGPLRAIASVAILTTSLFLQTDVVFAASSKTKSAADPIAQERINAAITQLDGLAAEVMAKTGVPGMAVAVVHDGDTLCAKGYGVREIGKDGAIGPDTLFQIASVSKSLAATVVAQQVGRDIIAWDTPVAKYLPWFRLQDPWVTAHVTIGDFFSHRSGLPDHAGDDLEDLGYGRREILQRLRFVPLQGFRDTYFYTNFGLTAAAEAVAVASGIDWASLSERMLYGPLGMSRTSSRFDDYMAAENRAVGHALMADGGFRPVSPPRMPDAQSPAGGVSSTVKDLARWMIMVLAGDEGTGYEKALVAAITPEVISQPSGSPEGRPGFYGYGFGVGIQPDGRTRVSHSGAFYLGAASNYVLLPSENLGIVALSNVTPVGAVETLTAQFMDLVQYGEITRDWLTLFAGAFAEGSAPKGELVGVDPPADPEPHAALSAYEGAYENHYFGPAKVTLEEGQLSLILGPDDQSFPLRHWSGDRFYFPVFNENNPDGSLSSVNFELDKSREARSFVVEHLNEQDLGRFERRRQ